MTSRVHILNLKICPAEYLQIYHQYSSSCCINPQKENSPDVHFRSQLNAPPEFPIGSKYLAASRTYIFLWPKLQNPYPWSVLGTGETVRSSMPQGTLLYPAYICPEPPARRDCPLIHAPWNIVITLHIIGHPQSPLHPYAMGHCQPP